MSLVGVYRSDLEHLPTDRDSSQNTGVSLSVQRGSGEGVINRHPEMSASEPVNLLKPAGQVGLQGTSEYDSTKPQISPCEITAVCA